MTINVRPGQLWRFSRFTVGDGSWMVELVTAQRRYDVNGGRFTFLCKDQLFTIVSLNDDGPYELPDVAGKFASSWQDGQLVLRQMHPKVWRVALIDAGLIWLDHGLIEEFSDLVVDAGEG